MPVSNNAQRLPRTSNAISSNSNLETIEKESENRTRHDQSHSSQSLFTRCTLHIGQTSGASRPSSSRAILNEIQGGPEVLLAWLELQLGLPIVKTHRASRVTEFAVALDAVTQSVFAKSMEADRWLTASDLLARREELLLSGWDGLDNEGLPTIVRDLARASAGRSFVFPCIAERLDRVLAALDEGQILPAHTCVLADSLDQWPARWQRLLTRLTIQNIPVVPMAAAEGTALRLAQSAVQGAVVGQVDFDHSLRYAQALSESAAVEYVAAMLATMPNELSRIAIICENDDLAVQLDIALRRYGIPAMGARSRSRAHPALQVLPLSLALCRNPVDPQCVLDFLTLPFCPIPKSAASALAKSLTVEPGLGSGAWEKAIGELCSAENDPDGKLQAIIASWLLCERVGAGAIFPTRLVRERCSLVAQWAAGLAITKCQDSAACVELINALRIAAGQAALLGELAECQGTELTEPQILRLIEEAQADGIESAVANAEEGGPTLVRSLADITSRMFRVIWLGLGTSDSCHCKWSVDQLSQLDACGVSVDAGTKMVKSLRNAEVRGLCHIENALLAIHLANDNEKRLHPVWLALRSCVSDDLQFDTLVLETLIEAGNVSALSPFVCPIIARPTAPSPADNALWSIEPSLLKDRETTSATELQDRLACPLKWVFRYQAKLYPSSIAQLPNEVQLKGNFLHRVLEYAFSDELELLNIDESVARVMHIFDERLSLDAAPLAHPAKYRERQSLRNELSHATRVLVDMLVSGGYRIKGIEVDVEGRVFGKTISGRMDCLAAKEDGREAIIDFKYSGKKYEQLMKEGRAVQLATYAHGRSTQIGRMPAVAYMLLSEGLILTPSVDPVCDAGKSSAVIGPSIREVWKRFERALIEAEAWLVDGNIPARPLQDPSIWPNGLEIVLETNLKRNETQPVCKYCEYQHLCGLRKYQ